jgi:nucleoside-diphosphate-sugar epimerase
MAERTRVLVTGATGFLGRRLANRLVGDGYEVRALARKSSDTNALRALKVEIALGDLGDASSVSAAIDGVDVVVHAAAGTSGTAKDSDTATIQGTKNVLAGCKQHQVSKLIYISSCNVYEVAGYVEGQLVTEEAQLERFPLRRGHYTVAKLHAEALVTAAMSESRMSTVVLRPGTLYGPGAEVYTRMMGISFARRIFVVFGNGKSELPLAHVDNVVDAIVGCMRNSAVDNQVFSVVDQDMVTKRMYMERVVKRLYPRATVIYCPLVLLHTLIWLQELPFAILRKPAPLSMYRLLSSQKSVRYSTRKLQAAIGWCPRIRFEEAAELMLQHGQVVRSD